MSETKLVNRIHETPGLKRDMEEAGVQPETAESFNRDKTGRIEIPVPFPFPPPSPDPEFAAAVAEARKEIRQASGTLQAVAASKAVLQELEKAGVEIDPDAVKSISGEPEPVVSLQDQVNALVAKSTLARDPDLAHFKRQVVAAFNHLGLDTRKFFGV